MSRLLRVGVGATVAVAALHQARRLADRHVPAGARGALGATAGVTALARRAAAELRAGTAEREAELRADLLAGADLARSRARLDAWRAERARARAADGPGDSTGDRADAAPPGAGAGPAGPSSRRSPRPGSAAAAGHRGTGAHRAEDPDEDSLGYSFF